jgi:hypothetical protein
MKQTIEDMSRVQIASFLPDAIAKALTSYQAFMGKDISKDKAKEFSEHHGACKTAIAHIELLLKLARWAELPDVKAGTSNEQIMLVAMMQEAEKELRNYKDIEKD